MNSEKHYHIRWSKFDWKRCPTREEASKTAEQIKKPNESYVIEERDDGCEICTAFKSKGARASHSQDSRTSSGGFQTAPPLLPALVRLWFGSLTIVVRRTSVEIEVVTTLSSFRFPELSQPI
jgi:hypothetical protein